MRMVSDLIDNTTGCWDMQRLKQSFLPMDWEAIASIPLSTRRQVDFWAWHYEKTGVFTVRSAYRMLVSNREKRTDWIEHNPGKSDCSAERNCARSGQIFGKFKFHPRCANYCGASLGNRSQQETFDINDTWPQTAGVLCVEDWTRGSTP